MIATVKELQLKKLMQIKGQFKTIFHANEYFYI